LQPQSRDVAQLVAHYVRDVGVAGSSPVIPTARKPRFSRGFFLEQIVFSAKQILFTR
jgi:hypothetical protein